MVKIVPLNEKIKAQFNAMKEKDPQLSFRKFAKDIGVPPGNLLQVANRKRPASEEILHALIKYFGKDKDSVMNWRVSAECTDERNYYLMTPEENKLMSGLDGRIVWACMADKNGEERLELFAEKWNLSKDYFKPLLKELVSLGILVKKEHGLTRFDSKAILFYTEFKASSPNDFGIRDLEHSFYATNGQGMTNHGTTILLDEEGLQKLNSLCLKFIETVKKTFKGKSETTVPYSFRVQSYPIVPSLVKKGT